jgi:hypothetical protein
MLMTTMLSICNGFSISSPISTSITTTLTATTTTTATATTRTSSRTNMKLQMASSPTATLDENTTWRLRFSLNGVPTKSGRKVGELFVVDVQFILEEGFEPPQGQINQILASTSASTSGNVSASSDTTENANNDDDDDESSTNTNDNVRYLQVKSGRWKLSEDPNDRKDGLWIWGLFEEPLYPFMLLQLETEEYNLPNYDSEKEDDAIKPMTLYAQINHKRDKKTGEVELDAATLNLREIESINADPFGVAKVDIFEEVQVGQLSLRPLVGESASSSAVL